MKMDVAAVIRRIREEVARRQSESAGSFAPGASGGGGLPVWSTALPPVPMKAEYTSGELLVHSDRAFVESAYMTVLRRPADPDGLAAYLQKLRSGEMSKVEVLTQLRWSPEGLARGVHVDGLLAPAKLHQWRRKRFVGPLIKWAHAIVRLPALAERSSYAEAIQAREIQEMGQLLNRLSAQVDARLSSGETVQASIAGRLESIEGEGLRQLQQWQHDVTEQLQRLDEALQPIRTAQAALDEVVSLQGASSASAATQLADLRIAVAAYGITMDEQRRTLDAQQARIGSYEVASREQREALAAELADQKTQFVTHGIKLEEQRATLEAQQARIGTYEAASTEQREALAADLNWQKGQLAAHGAVLAQFNRAEELRKEKDRALDPLYVAFEERFRGPREMIRERALPYLDIVRAAGAGTHDAPVLDIGCGRGDWLDILREHSLIARGVDSNRVFLDICRGRGLEVIEGDVLEILHGLDDASVGAITGMHIAEHLPFEVLVALLDEAKRVLRLGGVLALETPNPENLWVASHWFYMDPTHRNPLPPEMLRWIVEARGFADARIERWTVARELPAPPLLDPETPGAASINVLLGQLHAAPDYAIVGRRIQ